MNNVRAAVLRFPALSIVAGAPPCPPDRCTVVKGALTVGVSFLTPYVPATYAFFAVSVFLAFALLNLAAWAIDRLWLAPLAMWWLRPVFDRIPLYVLSRAVFGSVPTVADTLRAQLHWGWRPMLGHLTWRRLSPFRTAMLPVDLLEGAAPAVMRERRRVIGAGNGGHAAMLLLMCLHFIVALQLSALLIPIVFVPNELLSETARGVWLTITERPPAWALIALNLVDWLAVDRVEGREYDMGLHRHWLDPSKPFAETVLKPAHGALITSATLRAGGDWDVAEARSGAFSRSSLRATRARFGAGIRTSVAASATETACGRPTLRRSIPDPIKAALNEPAISVTVRMERTRAGVLPCEAPTTVCAAMTSPWPVPKRRGGFPAALPLSVFTDPTVRPCIVLPNLRALEGACRLNLA